MKRQSPKREPSALDADDERLLLTISKSPAALPVGAPADTARLDRLVTDGYLVQDPNLTTARFRLTIRGWAVVRRVAPKAVDERPFDDEEE